MKIIVTPNQLNNEIKRLIKTYKQYYWAMAWASTSFECYNLLLKNKRKIKQMIVGIHLYQTDPEFIKRFMNSDNVRFMKQPNGIFHPKIYFFQNNDKDWECIIGSPNFTKSAFTENSEIAVLFSNEDEDSNAIYNLIIKTFHDYWYQSNQLDKEFFLKYINFYKRHRIKLMKASQKSPLDSTIITMSWKEFYNKVIKERSCGYNPFEARMKILNKAQRLFQKHSKFCDMDDESRKIIAGFSNDRDIDWWFGHMPNWIFMHEINQNNRYISKALEYIPLNGQVKKYNFDKFIIYFKKAFPNGGVRIAPPSRLLCMKRPDYFLCLNSLNKKQILKDFGISNREINYDEYWDVIIERILDSEWWNSPVPTNKLEKEVWNKRLAFLDSIYYKDV